MSVRLALIAARASNGVIGRDGELPWRLASDMAYFKQTTMGKPCLMGRKTWDSLPPKFRPLSGRPCLVLTRDEGYEAEGAETFHDFDAMALRGRMLAEETGAGEAMVIGGEALYRLALPRADRIYLTEVAAEIEGDAVFPELGEDWVEVARERSAAGPRDDYAFILRTLDRTR